jgi:hypothetical protein
MMNQKRKKKYYQMRNDCEKKINIKNKICVNFIISGIKN